MKKCIQKPDNEAEKKPTHMQSNMGEHQCDEKISAIENEKARVDFLRMLAHDLRAPLAAIVGSAYTVAQNIDALSKEQIQCLTMNIAQSGERLIPMIENALTITKLDGDFRLNKMEELAGDILYAAIRHFRESESYKDIKIIVDAPKKVILIPMDAVLIVRVLLNLMNNSAYHGEHTKTIWMKVFYEKDKAIFTVEDDGVGFVVVPEKDKKRNSKTRGMGIGLECCKTVIREHGGTLTFGNRPEGGARSQFTLPLYN